MEEFFTTESFVPHLITAFLVILLACARKETPFAQLNEYCSSSNHFVLSDSQQKTLCHRRHRGTIEYIQ